jgi:hypothetical protein
MFLRKFALLVLLVAVCNAASYGQQDDFCEAIEVIIKDAPNKFRNVRGKLTDASMKTGIWESSIKVPGTIASRFISSMGLFYEGAFYQTKQRDSLRAPYEKFKQKLSDCLIPQGYSLTSCDNFHAGLGEYKKLLFMREITSDDKAAAPGHVSMEVEYSKELGSYSIVMFIFEH